MNTVWTGPADVTFAGTMMNEPLLLKSIVERAGSMFGDQVVVTYSGGEPHVTTYSELVTRVRRLASALHDLGVRRGDRVATFMWNSREHLEFYLAVPAMGAVIHPLNIRLHAGELSAIIEHAGDSVLAVDAELADRLPAVASSVRKIAVGGSVDGGLDYEELVASGDEEFEFPRIPEESASTMCYTSGTTGMPKGVIYTHRSTVLHTILQSLPDNYGICEADVVLPIVPMFHANAWGLPYATLMAGGRLVLPGSTTASDRIAELVAEQRVTFVGAVPTVWHDIAKLPSLPDLSSLRIAVAGGAPLSSAFLRRFDELGVPIVQGYGMTEANPFISVGRIPAWSTAEGHDAVLLRQAQGRPMPFVDVRLDAASGNEMQFRGPTIAASYYDAEDQNVEKFTEDGWMRTGDVAEISSEGIVRIVDRTKDMVKSGGEWISSVELENALGSHAAVAEVAVVAVPDSRWGERPWAYIVLRPGSTVKEGELHEHLAERVTRWWMPDRIEVVESMPRTSVGKVDKKVIRMQAASRAAEAPPVRESDSTVEKIKVGGVR